MARAFEKSEANGTDGGFSVWGDGGKYPCAAEAAGVDVGSMLEAGVDAKQLWEFVSNYRKEEGILSLLAVTKTPYYFGEKIVSASSFTVSAFSIVAPFYGKFRFRPGWVCFR